MGTLLRENYPVVENATRIYEAGDVLQFDNISLPVRSIFTDPAYFALFDFELVAAEARQALSEAGHIVLSQETVSRLFGEVDPIGRTVVLEGFGELVVSGVSKKPEGKTHRARGSKGLQHVRNAGWTAQVVFQNVQRRPGPYRSRLH